MKEFLVSHGLEIILAGVVVILLLTKKHSGANPPQGDLLLMFKVKNDHPPIPYEVAIGKVSDSEGEEITDSAVLAGLKVVVESTDTGVLSVTELDGPKKGEIGVGHSGQASINARVEDASGNILAAAEPANFVVTTGDPGKIDSFKFNLSGVTEEAAPPVAEPPVAEPSPETPPAEPGTANPSE